MHSRGNYPALLRVGGMVYIWRIAIGIFKDNRKRLIKWYVYLMTSKIIRKRNNLQKNHDPPTSLTRIGIALVVHKTLLTILLYDAETGHLNQEQENPAFGKLGLCIMLNVHWSQRMTKPVYPYNNSTTTSDQHHQSSMVEIFTSHQTTTRKL